MTDIEKIVPSRPLTGPQLSKMLTFEAAARYESFALAAQALSLTPSAISHQINQLENELGIELFARSHRKVELTEEGRRLFWTVSASLEAVNRELLDIKNQALSGTLTVYCRPSLAQCWLVPALDDFARQYPAIALTVLTGNESVDFQQSGIDVAIYYDDGATPPSYQRHYLMDEAILPVCSPGYAQRFNLYGNPSALARCTLLHDRQAWGSHTGPEEWHSWAASFDIALPSSAGIGFDRSDLAVTAAVNHAGVAIGRRRLVQKQLDRGELVAPFGTMMRQCDQHYSIATSPHRQWPKIERFVEWLRVLGESLPRNTA